ncbi:MAG: transporter [Rhodanobacteraceae bacterium]|nr:MAG: transporter [Rhodanobacteraceae bacterium]
MNHKLLWAGMVAVSVLGLAVRPAHADDTGHVTASAGFDYSSGTYGTPFSTDIWDVPFSVGYQGDRWSVKLTVPWVSISGANDVIPGIGRVKNNNPHGRGKGRGNGNGNGGITPVPPVTETTGSASGLGDIVAQATYGLVRDDADSFGLDLTGKVKFGTASADKGLGTGQNDYGVNLDAYKGFGAWTAFGGAGYMKYGSSQYIVLHNGWNANVGAGYKLDASDDIGAYFYYRQKISDFGYAQRELTGYWNHRFGSDWRLQAYVLGGFSDGSPDWGVGGSLRYAF